jgi:ubiquinone/menaquinone biosynthesis C-methylase UbiE
VSGRRPRQASRIVARYLAYTPRPLTVLDLGAGRGRIARVLERVIRGRVTACDVNVDRVRQGHRPSGGAVAADGQSLPFASTSFDAVYLVDVMHHVGDARALLGEVARVLVTGGRVIIVDVDAHSLLGASMRVVASVTGRRCRFMTPAALAAMLRATGFEPRIERLDRAAFVAIGDRWTDEAPVPTQHRFGYRAADLGAGRR